MATFLQSRTGLALLAFLAIASFYLITEHTAHVFGILPYALLLLCPLLHVFMHGGHGGQGSHEGHTGHSGHSGHGQYEGHDASSVQSDYVGRAGHSAYSGHIPGGDSTGEGNTGSLDGDGRKGGSS